MAISDYSSSASSNTSISGIDIGENCARANVNNAFRQMMADIKTWTKGAVVFAEDFGAIGDGSTDDKTALTAFINSAIANPGVLHLLGKKTYCTTGALPTINVSNVWIEGQGADIHDVGTLITGTVIKYVGSATATPILTVAAPSGASNMRLCNIRLAGIGFDCNNLADYGVVLTSVMRCHIDLTPINAKVAAVSMSVATTLGEAKDNQRNIIHLRGRQVEANGYCLKISGDAAANTSMNEFYCDFQHYNGAAILCENSDNNDWRFVRCYKVGGGTATECISLLGGASAGVASRSERFWFLSCNTPVHAYGTGSYTAASMNHQIFSIDDDNGSPAPTVDTGASVHYRFGKAVMDDDSWASFTPTIASSSGTITTTASVAGYYRKRGKVCEIKIQFTITTNGTGAGTITATLPFQGSGSSGSVLSGIERGVSGKTVSGFIDGTATTAVIRFADGTYPGANGAIFTLSGSYEVAS